MRRVAKWLYSGDTTTFFWVNHSWRCSFSDAVMPIITHLGGAGWSIILSLVLMLNRIPLWHQTGTHLALSLLVSHLVVMVCKRIIPRNRPYKVLQEVLTGRSLLSDASFPSGHATAAFCMATVLSMGIPGFGILFYVLAFLVGCSRVYLGLHYPSDVVIGAGVGTVTALLTI